MEMHQRGQSIISEPIEVKENEYVMVRGVNHENTVVFLVTKEGAGS